MPARYFLIVSAIGAALLLGQGPVMSYVQAFSNLVKTSSDAVRDGAKVTVQYHITLLDDPTMSYSATEQFVQGQHLIPHAIEQQVAGMQPGETKTFSLSAEEGFGPYDATKTQTIPTADLPIDAREGDIVDDDAGRTAKIVSISPDTTILDLNHPLAGQPLRVTLVVMTIEIPEDVDNGTLPGNGDHLDVVIVHPRTAEYPGHLSTNEIDSNDRGSVKNPGNPNRDEFGLRPYGNPYSPSSATNFEAIKTARLYDQTMNDRCRMSVMPYDCEEVSNPYGRSRRPYSPDSFNNRFSAETPYSPSSPTNLYGRRLRIEGR